MEELLKTLRAGKYRVEQGTSPSTHDSHLYL